MSNVLELLYRAKLFEAGPFSIAGTLCGNVDFATPCGTWNLSVEELDRLISALQKARDDVVKNSRPYSDPRLYDLRPQ